MTSPKIARTCSIENCEESHEAKGLCAKHYARLKKYGSTEDRPFVPTLCSVDDCSDRATRRGWCNKHRQRMRLTGRLTAQPRNYGIGDTFEEKFWSRVNKDSGQGPNGDCWEWQAQRLIRNGYGMATFQGKQQLVHRIVYKLAHPEEDIADKVIRHDCDNPPCCREDHLKCGTCQDNVDDKVKKGRQSRGSSSGRAKLTESDIPVIQAMLKGQISHRVIAEFFHVSRSLIGYIEQGKIWKHVK